MSSANRLEEIYVTRTIQPGHLLDEICICLVTRDQASAPPNGLESESNLEPPEFGFLWFPSTQKKSEAL